MRILVLTFYFRPDLSAGAFRVTPIVEALRIALPPDSQIDVVTTLPNRYQSYAAAAPELETQPGLTIARIPLPRHASGMVDQSKAFITFAREVRRRTAGQRYDLVFATSSRLMTAALGASIARRTHARLYLDIRDIFVETIRDVMPHRLSGLLYALFDRVERRTVGRADSVNLVSRGFADYFEPRYPRIRFTYFTNGIDDEFLNSAEAYPVQDANNRPLTVLYAGNLGEGQGLHAIIPQLASRMGARLQFQIIGDGGRKKDLLEALDRAGVTNVKLLAPLQRPELIRAYNDADVLFLHLNDHAAFARVLPSKLFEYAATGKPIWAGIGGFSARFARAEIENVALFDPCDAEGAVRAFEQLSFEPAKRAEFVNKYARAAISRAIAADIISVARGEA
jgi:hypothetical protein